MKILLLNQAFYPDVASTAQHLSDLAATLADRGHEVTVLCSRRAYDSPEQRYATRDHWRGVNIRRISSFGFGKKARWRRAADFGSYLANCVLHLAVLPKFDLVLAMTSPPLISFLGAVFVRIKGGRFVFWVMDLNPDEALAAGWLRSGSLTTKLLKMLLQYGLDKADAIVALDRFMADRIAAKAVPRKKIAVLPPWSHDQVVRYDEAGRRQFRQRHGLDDAFVVMYSGNHSPCHPLKTLLEAAVQLREDSSIVFCFVGGGSEFRTVQEFATANRLTNIKTLPYQPIEGLSASLSSADLHVVVMGEPFVGLVHPCKVYNLRTIGSQYLYIGPTPSHISEMKPPFSAAHGDVQSVVRHIQRAAKMNSRSYQTDESVSEHGHEQLIPKMVEVLESSTVSISGKVEAQWIGNKQEY